MLRNDTDDAVRAVYNGLDFVSDDDDELDVVNTVMVWSLAICDV